MLLNRKGRRSALADLANVSKTFYKNINNEETVIVKSTRPLSSLINHFNAKTSDSHHTSSKADTNRINKHLAKVKTANNLTEAFSQLALAKQNKETTSSNTKTPTDYIASNTRRVSQLFENLTSMKHEQVTYLKSVNPKSTSPTASKTRDHSPPNQFKELPLTQSTPKPKLLFDKKETTLKNYNQSLIFNSFYQENKQNYSLSLSANFFNMLDIENEEEEEFKSINADILNADASSYLTLSTFKNKNTSNYSLASTDYFDDSTSDMSTMSVQPLSDTSSYNSNLNSIEINSSVQTNNTIVDYGNDTDCTLNNTLSLSNIEANESCTKLDFNNNNNNIINDDDTDEDVDGYNIYYLFLLSFYKNNIF